MYLKAPRQKWNHLDDEKEQIFFRDDHAQAGFSVWPKAQEVRGESRRHRLARRASHCGILEMSIIHTSAGGSLVTAKTYRYTHAGFGALSMRVKCIC